MRHITRWAGKECKTDDIPSKSEKYEHPDPKTEPDWEFAAQDIGIESLPEFMMALWHMAREAYDDENHSHSPNHSWYSRWRWRQPQQAPLDPEPQMPGLPTHELQQPQDQVNRRWQDHIRRIRVYIQGNAIIHQCPN